MKNNKKDDNRYNDWPLHQIEVFSPQMNKLTKIAVWFVIGSIALIIGIGLAGGCYDKYQYHQKELEMQQK